jgi:hypothetical protein
MNFKQFLETSINIVSENDLKKILKDTFKSPSIILEHEEMCKSTLPFIYAEENPILGIKSELLIGTKDSEHDEITEHLKDLDVDAGFLDDFEEYTAASPRIVKSRLFEAIHNDDKLITKTEEMLEVHGAVGRIGYSINKELLKTAANALRKKFDVVPNIDVVLFYAHSITTPAIVKKCILELKALRKIRPNTYLVFGKQIEKIDAIETLKSATKEENEHARLQVAYHTGSWSDGRPVTPKEKKYLAEKLGLIKTYPPEKTWGNISSQLAKKYGPHSTFTASENKIN